MPHEVFISHSSKDKVYADAVCARLESEGIRCWIAPRDILPGMSWGSAIVEAIEAARLMVLLFSSNANASPQIEREVERALNKELPIVPLRIESVVPGKSLEYFLGTPHWLDAVTPPFEQHLEYITQTVKALLQHGQTGEAVDVPHPAEPAPHTTALETPMPREPTPSRSRGISRRWLGAGAAAVAVVILALLGWWLLQVGAVPRRFAGAWTTTNFVGPDKVQFTLRIGDSGTYHYEILYKESGKVRVSGGQVYLRTADGLERPAGALALASAPPSPANLGCGSPVWYLADNRPVFSKYEAASGSQSVHPGASRESRSSRDCGAARGLGMGYRLWPDGVANQVQVRLRRKLYVHRSGSRRRTLRGARRLVESRFRRA